MGRMKLFNSRTLINWSDQKTESSLERPVVNFAIPIYTKIERTNGRPAPSFQDHTNTANELAGFQDDLASMYTPESKKIKYLQEATASAILASSYGRCFFVTDAGYIGTAPSHLEYGDEIWILQGGR
jgi:hypothetical protein